jgi:hypothetical protein
MSYNLQAIIVKEEVLDFYKGLFADGVVRLLNEEVDKFRVKSLTEHHE